MLHNRSLLLFGVFSSLNIVVKAQLLPPECKAKRPLMPKDEPAPTITTKVFLDLHATKNKNVMDKHQILDKASGRIVLGLFGELCPKIVETFLSLITGSTEAIGSTTNNSSKPILYYKGSTFYRIVKDFMIQGGDLHGNSIGGAAVPGFPPPDDECLHKFIFDKPFLLALASKGPNTTNSQFFITTVKTRWLDSKHAIFGKVLDGFEVVKALESLGTASGKPSNLVTIVNCGIIDV